MQRQKEKHDDKTFTTARQGIVEFCVMFSQFATFFLSLNVACFCRKKEILVFKLSNNLTRYINVI